MIKNPDDTNPGDKKEEISQDEFNELEDLSSAEMALPASDFDKIKDDIKKKVERLTTDSSAFKQIWEENFTGASLDDISQGDYSAAIARYLSEKAFVKNPGVVTHKPKAAKIKKKAKTTNSREAKDQLVQKVEQIKLALLQEKSKGLHEVSKELYEKLDDLMDEEKRLEDIYEQEAQGLITSGRLTEIDFFSYALSKLLDPTTPIPTTEKEDKKTATKTPDTISASVNKLEKQGGATLMGITTYIESNIANPGDKTVTRNEFDTIVNHFFDKDNQLSSQENYALWTIVDIKLQEKIASSSGKQKQFLENLVRQMTKKLRPVTVDGKTQEIPNTRQLLRGVLEVGGFRIGNQDSKTNEKGVEVFENFKQEIENMAIAPGTLTSQEVYNRLARKPSNADLFSMGKIYGQKINEAIAATSDDKQKKKLRTQLDGFYNNRIKRTVNRKSVLVAHPEAFIEIAAQELGITLVSQEEKDRNAMESKIDTLQVKILEQIKKDKKDAIETTIETLTQQFGSRLGNATGQFVAGTIIKQRLDAEAQRVIAPRKKERITKALQALGANTASFKIYGTQRRVSNKQGLVYGLACLAEINEPDFTPSRKEKDIENGAREYAQLSNQIKTLTANNNKDNITLSELSQHIDLNDSQRHDMRLYLEEYFTEKLDTVSTKQKPAIRERLAVVQSTKPEHAAVLGGTKTSKRYTIKKEPLLEVVAGDLGVVLYDELEKQREKGKVAFDETLDYIQQMRRSNPDISFVSIVEGLAVPGTSAQLTVSELFDVTAYLKKYIEDQAAISNEQRVVDMQYAFDNLTEKAGGGDRYLSRKGVVQIIRLDRGLDIKGAPHTKDEKLAAEAEKYQQEQERQEKKEAKEFNQYRPAFEAGITTIKNRIRQRMIRDRITDPLQVVEQHQDDIFSTTESAEAFEEALDVSADQIVREFGSRFARIDNAKDMMEAIVREYADFFVDVEDEFFIPDASQKFFEEDFNWGQAMEINHDGELLKGDEYGPLFAQRAASPEDQAKIDELMRFPRGLDIFTIEPHMTMSNDEYGREVKRIKVFIEYKVGEDGARIRDEINFVVPESHIGEAQEHVQALEKRLQNSLKEEVQQRSSWADRWDYIRYGRSEGANLELQAMSESTKNIYTQYQRALQKVLDNEWKTIIAPQVETKKQELQNLGIFGATLDADIAEYEEELLQQKRMVEGIKRVHAQQKMLRDIRTEVMKEKYPDITSVKETIGKIINTIGSGNVRLAGLVVTSFFAAWATGGVGVLGAMGGFAIRSGLRRVMVDERLQKLRNMAYDDTLTPEQKKQYIKDRGFLGYGFDKLIAKIKLNTPKVVEKIADAVTSDRYKNLDVNSGTFLNDALDYEENEGVVQKYLDKKLAPLASDARSITSDLIFEANQQETKVFEAQQRFAETGDFVQLQKDIEEIQGEDVSMVRKRAALSLLIGGVGGGGGWIPEAMAAESSDVAVNFSDAVAGPLEVSGEQTNRIAEALSFVDDNANTVENDILADASIPTKSEANVVETLEPSETIAGAATEPTEAVADYREITIHRNKWWGNNTEAFDKNELKLHWGGESDNGVTDGVVTVDGNQYYEFDINKMIQGDSRLGDMEAPIKKLIDSNTADLTVTAQDGKEFQFDIVDGKVRIAVDSEPGESFTIVNGKAQFHGKYAEVMEPVKDVDTSDPTYNVVATLEPATNEAANTVVETTSATTQDIATQTTEQQPTIITHEVSSIDQIKQQLSNAYSNTESIDDTNTDTQIIDQNTSNEIPQTDITVDDYTGPAASKLGDGFNRPTINETSRFDDSGFLKMKPEHGQYEYSTADETFEQKTGGAPVYEEDWASHTTNAERANVLPGTEYDPAYANKLTYENEAQGYSDFYSDQVTEPLNPEAVKFANPDNYSFHGQDTQVMKNSGGSFSYPGLDGRAATQNPWGVFSPLPDETVGPGVQVDIDVTNQGVSGTVGNEQMLEQGVGNGVNLEDVLQPGGPVDQNGGGIYGPRTGGIIGDASVEQSPSLETQDNSIPGILDVVGDLIDVIV